jgi:hypothetical protein
MFFDHLRRSCRVGLRTLPHARIDAISRVGITNSALSGNEAEPPRECIGDVDTGSLAQSGRPHAESVGNRWHRKKVSQARRLGRPAQSDE